MTLEQYADQNYRAITYCAIISKSDRFDHLRRSRPVQTGDPRRFERYRDLPMRYVATLRAMADDAQIVVDKNK